MVFVNKFDRIRDQLSTMALVVPVLQELLMEESMFALKENVVKFVLRDWPVMIPPWVNEMT